MNVGIQSKTQRTKLAPRREPYWSRIEKGFFLGYRKLAQGEGSWIARLNVDGHQRYHALGAYDDFDAAQAAAREWRAQVDQGVIQTGLTVEDVCRTYVEHRGTLNGSASQRDAEGRFRRLVFGKPIGRIELLKLKTTDVRRWLNAQVTKSDGDNDEAVRRSKDSANRNLATLKAALNLSLKDRLVANDAGWKTVVPFRDVGNRRQHALDQDQRRTLLEACPSDLQMLVKAMLLTGARPGELANLKVGDFDPKLGVLSLSGKRLRRTVTVSTAAREFLASQCVDKLPTAWIFVTAAGLPWGKDSWKKPFKQAVRATGLPDDVVLYSLRHTAISELLIGGISTGTVAMLVGTSTAMIDKHYGHLLHEQTRQRLDRIAMV